MAISGRAHTHTHGTICVYVRALRFGSAYTCSLLIRHVVRSQKPLADTSVRPPIKAVAMHSPPHSCQVARWHHPAFVAATRPTQQRQQQQRPCSHSPCRRSQRVVSSGCRMDLVCHVCVAAACTACLMSTKGACTSTGRQRSGGGTRITNAVSCNECIRNA